MSWSYFMTSAYVHCYFTRQPAISVEMLLIICTKLNSVVLLRHSIQELAVQISLSLASHHDTSSIGLLCKLLGFMASGIPSSKVLSCSYFCYPHLCIPSTMSCMDDNLLLQQLIGYIQFTGLIYSLTVF